MVDIEILLTLSYLLGHSTLAYILGLFVSGLTLLKQHP
jgi:hypothetical protein